MQRLQLNVQRPDDRRPRQILAGHFPFRIGRALDNDLSLPAPSISSSHLLIERDADGIVATDLGSTNGTVLADERLPAHQPRRLELPSSLRLGEVSIEIRSPEGDEPGFTMAESATELRKIVDDTLRKDNIDESRPLFEILSGPGSGQRFYIEVDGPQILIGTGPDADIRLDVTDAPERLARVFWRDMHCWLEAETPMLTHNATSLEAERRLRDGDRFVIGIIELLYFDPLEGTLASIDPERWNDAEDEASGDEIDQHTDQVASDHDHPKTVDHEPISKPQLKAPSRNDESPNRFGAIELGLLAMSLFFLVGSIALMVLFFTW